MRVLVTGGNGYLGRAVVDQLAAAGHEPVAMVRDPDPVRRANTRVADLLDSAAVQAVLYGIDAVCHLAARTRARESIVDPLSYFQVNTTGTVILLEAMAAHRVSRLVFASTGAIYGTPDRQPMTEDLPDSPPHPYAASKLAAEFAVQAQARAGALSATILRFMNIAGGDDRDPTRLIPRTIAAAQGRGTLEINGDGSAMRDYLHVSDAARAILASVEDPPPRGESVRYVVGSGCGTSVAEVVAAVERRTGRPVPVRHGPTAPEPPELVSDPTRIMAELGWRPACSDIDTIVSDSWRHARATTEP
ncbi:UDP-glucose 4-epimerase [Nocardia farcinica]|uniref:NAD-dependent epimerase/dehydratase family protein n=1 Tax=Nocardia farcinica TaxID=37329 RepID=UPI001B3C6065|nr:NAD-dependent epimerase/dehydratase family protein [Nocardia farcinica]MBF6539465.1 UDP-glucose 4-epimerase [Nocardia farcinica]